MSLNLFGVTILYPLAIVAILPLAILLIWLIKKDLFKIKEELDKKVSNVMIITRVFILLFLLLAISSPYQEREKVERGSFFVKILNDESNSFSLYEQNTAKTLQKELRSYFDVELEGICTEERSPIGDGILGNIKRNENIMLVSDGNNNYGTDLGDIAVYASRLNVTINSVKLNPIKKEYSVSVVAPEKTMADVENMIYINIDKSDPEEIISLRVTLDGEILIEKETAEQTLQLTRAFTHGYHKLTAEIFVEDTFPQNNKYYHAIRVVPKPKIAIYSNKEKSPLRELLDQIYDVTKISNFDSLEGYTALVINDVPAPVLEPYVDKITEYITNGNGLIMVGGMNSYDKGGYKGSLVETLLPVYVAKAGRKEGEANLVLMVDISGSTGSNYGKGKAVDVEKALALGVLNDLGFDNKVGVVAFDSSGYIISDMGYLFEKNEELKEKIARLTSGGGTRIDQGLSKAFSLLDKTSGSKNIILISDGKTKAYSRTKEMAYMAASKGIKIYAVGVGKSTNELNMQEIAEITKGIYFKATDSNKLRILFGDPNDIKDKGVMSLITLDKNHFITKNYEMNSTTITGYNQVVPKSAAKLLITTDTAAPILSVWRFGLGRIVAFTTDDGSLFAGNLLTMRNSRIISRIMNWGIGDPDRKEKDYVSISDARVNEPAEITLRSEGHPRSETLEFYKVGEDLYSSTIIPESTGFMSILGTTFSVNYPKEYEDITQNENIENIVGSTGGRMFDKDNIEDMIKTLKSQSQRSVVKKIYYRWIFVLLAMALFLFEIGYRRLYGNKKRYK